MVVGSGWLCRGDKKRKLMRLKERYFEQNGGLMLQRQVSNREGFNSETAKIFTAKELKTTTDNFAESRIVGRDGNTWYLDPEYLQTSKLTEKSDVYSFGVVLLELLTGTRALCFDGPEKVRNLAMFFLSALKEDCLFQILEYSVIKEGNAVQHREVANVAKLCLRIKAEERPTLKEVAMELEGLRMIGKHPWFNAESNATEYLLSEDTDHIAFADGRCTCVGNDSMGKSGMSTLCDGR
ncbi:Wall-associated receptor kinase [Quillaja saponaria]|uniref:Wall-associated receptor kinase n=1 Tax=Quillaja saponaria TaxID=32244 RepID=A0AAD7LJG1_QUISA|nr:Wall-associated receptor kinase [Quillaja saponaria]